MKKYFFVGSILLVCIILAGTLVYINLQNKNPNSVKNTDTSSDTNISTLSSSSPLLLPISEIKDIRVDLQYENSGHAAGALIYPPSAGTYVDPATKEEFLLLPKKIAEKGYGKREYSIFRSIESHSYQGTPVYLSIIHNNQSLSYIGLKLNDLSLIESLKVELGVDYLAHDGENDMAFSSKILNKITSLFSPKKAEACGPGIYLRSVGSSSLTYVGSNDDISWFKLDNEISVSDIPLKYCDGVDCNYSNNVKDLNSGNLRMHIDYVPAGKNGSLKVQLADAVFHNQETGTYSKASLGKGISDIYKAVLTDQENGTFTFIKNSNDPAKLDLVLKNSGDDSITIDDYSFNRIRNSFQGKQTVGFVIKDSRSNPVAHLYLDSILNQTKGKTLLSRETLAIPAINASFLPDGFYTISVEYSSGASLAPTVPRLISWDFRDGQSMFNSNGSPLYGFVTNQHSISLPTIIPLYTTVRNLDTNVGSTYGLSYLFPSSGTYPQFSIKSNAISQYSIRQTSIREVLDDTGAIYSYFISSPTTLETFLFELNATPTGTLADFDGNKITVYTRGTITGYAVERDIKSYNGKDAVRGVLVYEIPTSFLEDISFKQIYEMTVRSGSTRKDYQ